PIRGAEVRARESNGRENRLATSNDRGEFELRDLIPGTWTLTASKSGFITQQYGQTRPFSAPESLQVGTRQRVQANFMLGRAGAISGRVFDEFGDPVAGARVQVLRSRMARGRRTLAASGVGDETDDTGSFRLYALPPGDYYIGAALNAASGEAARLNLAVGVPTYYPGTVSVAEAQRIRLAEGEEQSNLLFSLSPVRAVRISGTVLSSRGPAEDATVRLLSTSDLSLAGVPLGNFGMTQADGAFTIVNVAPGSYILQASAGATHGPTSEGAEDAAVPVVVAGDDISGLTVTTAPSATLTGRVTTDSGAQPPQGVEVRFDSSTGWASVSSTVGGPPNGPTDRRPRPDATAQSTFRLPVTPEGVSITVMPPDGWMLKSIEVDGDEVTDRPIVLRGGPTHEARITLTDRLTQVGGTVRSGSRPAAGVDVLIFADAATLWTFPSRHVRVVRTGEDGTFRARGLPPQDYLAVALDYLDDGEPQDPELLEAFREKASRLSVDYGESRSIDLRLVER
ncbi:MAG TPA: carboxypeptidase-like regulatory domain-containing protein, partial [Vicinamibacterales bacterium]